MQRIHIYNETLNFFILFINYKNIYPTYIRDNKYMFYYIFIQVR